MNRAQLGAMVAAVASIGLGLHWAPSEAKHLLGMFFATSGTLILGGLMPQWFKKEPPP